MAKRIAETIIVKVSLLGLAKEGIGTATVDVDVDVLGAGGAAFALKAKVQEALTSALADVQDELAELWHDGGSVEFIDPETGEITAL